MLEKYYLRQTLTATKYCYFTIHKEWIYTTAPACKVSAHNYAHVNKTDLVTIVPGKTNCNSNYVRYYKYSRWDFYYFDACGGYNGNLRSSVTNMTFYIRFTQTGGAEYWTPELNMVCKNEGPWFRVAEMVDGPGNITIGLENFGATARLTKAQITAEF